MIWQLVKRETAWREIYGYVAVVAALSALLPEQASSIFTFVVGLTWVRSLPAERASLLHAGLPIAAADLFLSRVLAFGALIWLPTTAGAVVLLLTGHLANAGGMLTGAAAFSALALAALSHRVRELAGSHYIPAAALAIVFAAAWPVIEYVPRNVVVILCGVASVGLFAAIWFRLPLSFEVVGSRQAASVHPGSQGERRSPVRLKAGRSQDWLPHNIPLEHWRPMLRRVIPISSLGFLPIVIVQGMAGQWIYSTSMAIFPVLTALGRIAWLRGLPISRGTLLTVMVAPWSLVLALNLLVGGLFMPARTPIHYDYVADKLGSILPPLEYWRLAPGGKAPVIESPWRETWQPPVEQVAGVAIYNPYSLGAANSRRFLEWQYRRATLAIYGQEIPFNDYHPAKIRPLQQQPRFVALNIAAGQCWVLVLLNIVLLSMHWRVQRVYSRAAYFAGFLLLVPMLSPLILEVFIRHPGSSLGPALMNAALLRILAILPGGVAPVLAALVPLGILCWSAQRLFGGIETAPVDPTVRA